jgi:hypothetical protein
MTKFNPEEIERGLRELGLSDAKTREALQGLSRMTQPEARPRHETITAAHTHLESQERGDAQLESSS